MVSISPDSPQDNPEYDRAVRRLNITAKGICSKCGKRPWDHKGKAHWCQVCRNEYARGNARKHYTPAKGRKAHLLRSYGITQEHYDLMVFQQAGLCAICGQAPEMGKQLIIDHCHKSKVVRELLCNRCNVMLGNAQDDTELLKKAIKYLKKHSI